MDKDRINGAAPKLKGSIEKTAGGFVGNNRRETVGKIEVPAGNIRKSVGEGKAVVREAIKNRTK